MPRRTKQEAEETRALILDTAQAVFRDKGVGHATLADIAAAAGVTRGAIYWHFANKAALLRAVNDRAQLPLDAINQRIADESLADPLAALRLGAAHAARQAAQDDRLRMVFEILSFKCEYVGEMAQMLERRRDKRAECVAAIRGNLSLAVGKGQLPADLDIHAAALGLYALVDGLFMNWLMAPDSFDLVLECPRQVEIFLTGLGARTGQGVLG